MEDPELFTLPCRLRESEPFDTLADLGSYDPETPLLVGRGFLATTNAVIDCRMEKIAEIARDVELNPFKDTLVIRRMVEFLRAIPINLKSIMWESEDLIKNPIDWDKSPKDRDGAWYANIRLIDPDGEEFTLQSIPTTRKLFERESPREIIDLDHFYDCGHVTSSTNIARITRKEPKPDKNRHENRKSTQKPGIYHQKSTKVNLGQLM
nr:hypothetical protein [Tanacetum cinerariifolium]